MWATYKGRSPTVTMLLARGADVNAHGNFHISSLLWAAGRGYPDIVKDLIAHGAKVNVGDKVKRFFNLLDFILNRLKVKKISLLSVWHHCSYMGVT